MSDISSANPSLLNVEGKDTGGRSALRDLFPNSPSAAAAAEASSMLANCAELQHILDKMDSNDNSKMKQALSQLGNQLGKKLARTFIAKEVLVSFAKFTSTENEEIELSLFSDVALVYASTKGLKYRLIEAFDVGAMFIRVPEARNEPFFSLIRVSTDAIETKAGSGPIVENERKITFQNAARSNEWVNTFRTALLAARSAEKGEDVELEYGWKHKLVRGTIFSACLLGETSLVKQLIQKNPDRVSATDADGCYPVHFAAHGGSIKVMDALCEAKCNLNVADKEGRTALHIALYQRLDKMVYFLCERGGEECLLARDIQGRTPLFSLLSYAADQTREGRKCLEALLEFGVDPNDKITANAHLMDGGKQGRNSQRGRGSGKGSHGRMPSIPKKGTSKISLEPGFAVLHICSRYNLKNLATMLLLSDASPSIASSPTAITPLAIALDVDNLDLARILLDLGAHPNIRDRVGRAPLNFAKTIEGAKLLVSYGARPELVTDKFNKNADVRALKFVRKRYLEKTAGVGVEGDKVASDIEWVEDVSSEMCLICSTKFSFLKRKHHCRRCGVLTCNECSNHQFIMYETSAPPTGLVSAASTPGSNPSGGSGNLLDAPVSDESPTIPMQARKSIMINPGRRNSKPDATGGSESGFVAQRCCDGCFNYLTCANQYDFEDVLDGRQKKVEHKVSADPDGDEVKQSSSQPSSPKGNMTSMGNSTNDLISSLQALLDKERAANSENSALVESLTASKTSLEEEINQLQKTYADSRGSSTAAKEAESLKSQVDQLSRTNAELVHNNVTKDTIIRSLLEECAQLEQYYVDLKKTSNSMPSPRGSQGQYIKDLEAQVLDLKKVMSAMQKEQEDMWKATEGMERSVAAKKGSKGSSNFGSLKKKNITELESRIANLEFQLVYGQTKKDQTISKLQERTKALEKELKDALHKGVESWLFDSEDSGVL